MKTKWKFEFFPKGERVGLQDTFLIWLLFGTFGAHQFYLGNKKRGVYLLLTSGISNFLVILAMSFKITWPIEFWFKSYIGVIILGFILGVPVYLLDPFKMVEQVRKANGNVNLL